MDRYGILLTNIGSPDQPSVCAVRAYLKKFLSDPRVVELPRLIWWPILYGFILPFRSRKSAKLYQKIWTNSGSPLVVISQQLAEKLQHALQIPVSIGMHYGSPDIECALNSLRDQEVNKIIILPLFPQYSATTQGTTFNQIADIFKTWRDIPALELIHDYHQQDEYINALCQSIQTQSIEHLLFSFHGIPEHCINRGDPYAEQCYKTVELVIEKLQWPKEKWSIGFQSRLGRAKWLMPYTEEVLTTLPTKGVKNLHVICPGFAVDCLETLEEIAIRGKEQFLNAGGETFHYIPALNTTDAQVHLLKCLVRSKS